MRKVVKYSYLPIKRKIDRYLSCEDYFAAPKAEFFEKQIDEPAQILKKRKANRIKKLLWIILFFISLFVAFCVFCGTASG